MSPPAGHLKKCRFEALLDWLSNLEAMCVHFYAVTAVTTAKMPNNDASTITVTVSEAKMVFKGSLLLMFVPSDTCLKFLQWKGLTCTEFINTVECEQKLKYHKIYAIK